MKRPTPATVDMVLVGPSFTLDECAAGPVPEAPKRCARCGVRRRGPVWRLRHRLFTCHAERLEVLERFRRRAELELVGEPF